MYLVLFVLSFFACKKDEETAPQPEKLTIEEKVSAAAISPSSFTINSLKGDGTTDNRAALQNLINSYASKNQKLVLPAGKFLISNTY
jgi:polygalacturonase